VLVNLKALGSKETIREKEHCIGHPLLSTFIIVCDTVIQLNVNIREMLKNLDYLNFDG